MDPVGLNSLVENLATGCTASSLHAAGGGSRASGAVIDGDVEESRQSRPIGRGVLLLQEIPCQLGDSFLRDLPSVLPPSRQR